jgi:hypothetical protein
MLSAILPPKPTPEEIAKAAPLREVARKEVLQTVSSLKDSEAQWKKAGFTDSDLKPIQPIQSWAETELAWWNANLELTPTQVKVRQTAFQEARPVKEKEVVNTFRIALSKKPVDQAQKLINSVNIPGKQELQSAINERRKQGADKEKKEQEAINKRTWWDDVKEATSYALRWTLVVVWIVLAFRFAGFAANDLLYKPLPYRVLSFIYTFIFAPVFTPYYMYREIMHWFFPSDDYKPHFESIFPVVPYDPSAPLTLDKRLYGYADTPAIREWMKKKQDEEKESWLEKLKSTVMADLIQKREEEINPS